jgi:hypothetical protein
VLGFVPPLDFSALSAPAAAAALSAAAPRLSAAAATARAERVLARVDAEFAELELLRPKAAPGALEPDSRPGADARQPRPPLSGSQSERRAVSATRRKRLVESGLGPPRDVLDPWVEAYHSGRRPAPRRAVLDAAAMGKLPALSTGGRAGDAAMGASTSPRALRRRTGW